METPLERKYTCEYCMYVTERLGESITGLPVSVTWYCVLLRRDLKTKTPICGRYRWGPRKYEEMDKEAREEKG